MTPTPHHITTTLQPEHPAMERPGRVSHLNLCTSLFSRTKCLNCVCVCVCTCTCLVGSGQKLHPFPEPTPDRSTVDLLPPWPAVLPRL